MTGYRTVERESRIEPVSYTHLATIFFRTQITPRHNLISKWLSYVQYNKTLLYRQYIQTVIRGII